MILIIGSMDKRLQQFIKNNNFSEKFQVINKMCNIKTITQNVKVIVPFQIVLKNGIVSNTAVHLEELIISLNVDKIIYTNIYNKEVMDYFTRVYNVKTEYLDLNKFNKLNFFPLQKKDK